MYKTALQNAKTAGETSKARRYDRGLKVSETAAKMYAQSAELQQQSSL